MTKVEDLIQLGLLSFGKATAKRVDTQIPLYSFSGDWCFIALILQYNESPDKMTHYMISSTL